MELMIRQRELQLIFINEHAFGDGVSLSQAGVPRLFLAHAWCWEPNRPKLGRVATFFP